MNRFNAIVIGCSAGGFKALKKILPLLPKSLPIPIIIVQHIAKGNNDHMIQSFNNICSLSVKEADDKEIPTAGYIYFAPPDYHLLISEFGEMTLSVDPPIQYSRPSIDELFISAAEYYFEKLIGIILTGANNDGTNGLIKIQDSGGTVIVQNPKTATVSTMPQSAIQNTKIDYILPLEKITGIIIELSSM